MKKTLLYTVFLLISVSLLLELVLRIYHPFNFRVKGNQVVLESNRKYIIDNSNIPVLEKSIVHTKNNVGFRGPDKPANLDSVLSVVTVGGSTTECAYLADGKTWTDVLNKKLSDNFPGIWINNAGVSGHSSFGHIALLKEHLLPLHPKYVVLLTGANDIRRSRLPSPESPFIIRLAKNSELVNTLLNLTRAHEAKKRNLTDTYVDLRKADSMTLTDREISNYLRNEHEWVDQYMKRLDTIVKMCRMTNTNLVLVTQPCLVGEGNDPVTGVSLERIKMNERENGKLWWSMLERYNEGTRKIARKHHLPLIDLAILLPKSSEYFYDAVHFTNNGAKQAGSIIYDSLRLIIRR